MPYLRRSQSRKHSWMESQLGPTAGEASVCSGSLRRELPRNFWARWMAQAEATSFTIHLTTGITALMVQRALTAGSVVLACLDSSQYCCGDPVLIPLDALWWDNQSRCGVGAGGHLTRVRPVRCLLLGSEFWAKGRNWWDSIQGRPSPHSCWLRTWEQPQFLSLLSLEIQISLWFCQLPIGSTEICSC